jgi:hypothetical protein
MKESINLNINDKIKHIKRGSEYWVAGIGKIQISTDIKDDDEVVIYRDMITHEIYVRPRTEFTPDRFELLS